MLMQLLVGSALISATIIVEVGFIGLATVGLTKAGAWLVEGSKILKLMISLLAIVLWMLAAISIAVWIWAAAFLALGQFGDLETALYFSVVSMTTLGYGDIVIGKEWRLLSGLIAANGLILFSLTTAFLIEFINQLRTAQSDALKN
ncbi:MAG: potassium channel family protein [Parasphingorhabdus sp.]|uniref:potassium channel family protein n=1 Tax=Parasphingorhabdus sp. TaxID=2709688 RepID=UPI0030028E44